jgi:mannosyltransferase
LFPLDEPFRVGCQEPDISAPRENATLVMLARNEDLEGAKITIKSVEEKFNKWYKYPIVFLNDREWSAEFKQKEGAMVSGKATFETIPDDQWGYPDFIDKDKARESIKEQGRKGLLNAGHESCHHMCRFYSGCI